MTTSFPNPAESLSRQLSVTIHLYSQHCATLLQQIARIRLVLSVTLPLLGLRLFRYLGDSVRHYSGASLILVGTVAMAATVFQMSWRKGSTMTSSSSREHHAMLTNAHRTFCGFRV